MEEQNYQVEIKKVNFLCKLFSCSYRHLVEKALLVEGVNGVNRLETKGKKYN